ncbi:MAG: DVU_1551 family NTP transferase [Thermoanaerobacteraceae bacterium]|jgi:putative nucleotidyltransferase with HDIG domain
MNDLTLFDQKNIKSSNIGAIILAAGQSSRMGKNKALLPINNKTFIEEEINLFHDFGIDKIVVVTGYNTEEIHRVISSEQVMEIHNPDPSRGMFSSVCLGVKHIASMCDAFFVLPVDIPLIRNCTLKLVLETWLNDRSRIIIPTFENQRGHPPLFPSSVAEKLLSWDGKNGLQGFLENYKTHIVEVFTPNEYMLLDVDTPQDYEIIKNSINYLSVPNLKECFALLQYYSVSHKIKTHSKLVALLAETIAKSLNEKGLNINPDIVKAAGLLHDIVRYEENHDVKGAKILNDLGFIEVADAIHNHMDMCIKDSDPITPAEIVFIADKYTLEESFIDIEKRYHLKIEKYEKDTEIKCSIENKLKCALKSKERIEKQIGMSINSLLSSIGYNIK